MHLREQKGFIFKSIFNNNFTLKCFCRTFWFSNGKPQSSMGA